jgi:hypothetical protein
MVRRVSATQWELKYDAGYRSKRVAELQALLSRPPVQGPSYEACAECGTHGGLELHRPSCSRYSEADERAAEAREDDEQTRTEGQDELERLEQEPAWKPFPKRLVASLETRYQRYLAHG